MTVIDCSSIIVPSFTYMELLHKPYKRMRKERKDDIQMTHNSDKKFFKKGLYNDIQYS